MSDHETSTRADRHWETKWYRATVRSFVHYELFYDPERILQVFAGESYKSFLLRRDGRDTAATEVGEDHRDVPAEEILAEDRNEAIEIADVEAIRLRSGTLLRKPKQTIVTADGEHEFYHFSRKHTVDELGEILTEKYPTIDVE